jgi:hypothetical protein
MTNFAENFESFNEKYYVTIQDRIVLPAFRVSTVFRKVDTIKSIINNMIILISWILFFLILSWNSFLISKIAGSIKILSQFQIYLLPNQTFKNLPLHLQTNLYNKF